MSQDQIALGAILCVAIGLFLWGRLRHDLVAVAALLACVAAGLVPAEAAFAGFSHPAVITVAGVLILSSALQATGAIDALARVALPKTRRPAVMIAAISALAALLSGFINNVGALALLMPLAIHSARKLSVPPGQVLMPLAFASILGGMTTLIGTPPNLIVSNFRSTQLGASFAMFDFTPVGLLVAVAGIAFIAFGGWRLVPARRRVDDEGFDIGAYLTEARVLEGSKAAGMTLRDLEGALNESDGQVVGLVRKEVRIPAPSPYREVRVGDILAIEADPTKLPELLSKLDLKLEESIRPSRAEDAGDGARAGSRDAGDVRQRAASLQSDEVALMEIAVQPRAELVGLSASAIRLRTRFGINLLAVSRKGTRSLSRLRTMSLAAGDLLLMQGPPESILAFAKQFGCVVLTERALRVPQKRKAALASLVMLAAVASAAFGLMPAAIAFSAGALAIAVTVVVPVRRIYDAIDWSVIVLLAALIPVAGAMATTGTADLIAKAVVSTLADGRPVLALTIILVVTMSLSDFMNNAATAAVMCPVASGAASQMNVAPDAFLMAVAVGASCAFLTPIGHQNNTLILGPGGFRFGDYWRLGLPIELLVVLVAVPAITFFWPVH